MTTATIHRSMMPWEDDPRSKRLLLILNIIGLLLVILLWRIIPLIPLPEKEVEEIPERFAELIIEEPEVIPPPPVPEEKLEKEKSEEKPVEKEPVKEESVEEKEPEEVAEEPEVEEVVEKPSQTVDEAREVAQQSGLLAFQDSLAAMRSQLSLQNTSAPVLTANNTQRKEYKGSDLNTDLTRGSGGVDSAAYTQNTGVTGNLGGRDKSEVSGGKIEASSQSSNLNKVATAAKSRQSGRSSEQINLANQRIKSSLDRMYNKARRSNPDLGGTVIFRVAVDTSGRVTEVTIVSSTLHDSELENKLASRLKLMANYGPGIEETLEFSIVFTP